MAHDVAEPTYVSFHSRSWEGSVIDRVEHQVKSYGTFL